MDYGHLADLWERVTDPRYMLNLGIYDIEYVYLINQATLQFGGSSGTPGRFIGCHKETVKEITTGNGMKVNCAAFALEWLLFFERVTDQPRRQNIIRQRDFMKGMADVAYRKQLELGWSDYVTMDQVKSYLSIVPDHRIVFLKPSMDNHPFDYCGPEYVFRGKEKILYLLDDPVNMHFQACKSPQEMLRRERGCTRWLWCFKCSNFHSPEKTCKCGTYRTIPETRKRDCEHCYRTIYKSNKHYCDYTICHFCNKCYKRGDQTHRCPVVSMKDNTSFPPFIGEHGADPKKSPALNVFDIESCQVLKVGQLTKKFVVDENHTFVEDQNGPVYLEVTASEHVPNLLVNKNVFTCEQKIYTDIGLYIEDMFTLNGGRNICLAHNSSGYDTCFIFNYVIKYVKSKHPDLQITSLMRGNKFLQLTIKLGGNREVIFRDSMLHLPGSLARLASEFLKGRTDISIKKGYFPHLANKEEFFGYEGRVLPIEYYDVTNIIKNENDYLEFKEWYATESLRTDWNFKKELEEYCVNDVHLLCEIVKLHHYTCLDVTSAGRGVNSHTRISPWHFVTAAGYVQQLFLTSITYDNDLREEGLEIAEIVRRAEVASKDSWCELIEIEYYFARLALRGGRTEVRKYYHKGPLKYIDIQSEYPFLQMARSMELCGEQLEILYPVGSPTIEIWDDRYYPCDQHYTKPNEVCECLCSEKKNRNGIQYKKAKIIEIVDQSINDYLDSFGSDYLGIIMVDATPPNDLYWPVLPTVLCSDETGGYDKCVQSLKPIVKGTFTTTELQLAVKMGYVVTKIYRCDRYKAAPSLWADFMKHLYKLKLYNSMEYGDDETMEEMVSGFKEKIDLDIDLDPSLWGKNPARKATSKVLLNSGWGKNAETIDHDQTLMLANTDDERNIQFYQSISDDKYKVSSFSSMGDYTLFKYTENRPSIRPKLRNTYLPAAVFVPMYGRLMLYDRLHQYGKNVIMLDTDSLIVNPVGVGHIKTGNLIGDFEEEPGDINEFAALGPKTYGLGYTDRPSEVKCKGLTFKRSHQNMVNLETYKRLINGGEAVLVPQMTFVKTVGVDVYTNYYNKLLKFDPSTLKGVYDPVTTYLYPFGWGE